MAFGVIEILGIIGFIIGLIVAVRHKKVDIMELLTGWGIFALFTPAWMVITNLLGVQVLTDICTNYINPLVIYFGLGIAIWVLIKKAIDLFQ